MILMLHVKSIKFEHIADYIHPKMKCCCSSPVADLELGRIDFCRLVLLHKCRVASLYQDQEPNASCTLVYVTSVLQIN